MAFASPVAQSVLLRLLTALLNLVLLGYTARMLGPGVRGEISLLIATLGIALHIAGMGGGSLLVYLLPRHPHGGIYRRALLWTTATAVGVALVALLVQANLPLHPALWPALLFASYGATSTAGCWWPEERFWSTTASTSATVFCNSCCSLACSMAVPQPT